MIKIGIIGGSGYVAGELMRCLQQHPNTTIDFVYSHSKSGIPVQEVHQDLFWLKGLNFTDVINPNVEVIFLCLGHGNSKQFLKNHTFSDHTKIIDLSNDFRLEENSVFQNDQFVYGLPELNQVEIVKAKAIANPGCFATAIQLALLPLAKHNWLKDEVHVHGITGSTGAGGSLSNTSHFSWRNNNVSLYKEFSHQHLDEIKENINQLQQFDNDLNFLPVRGDFTRGILASIYTKTDQSIEELMEAYKSYYSNHPFVEITNQTVHLKQVVNTNFCLLQIQKIDGKVLITSAIDNLIKGAAGQAIQNMNLMFGWDQTLGLQFKPTYF